MVPSSSFGRKGSNGCYLLPLMEELSSGMERLLNRSALLLWMESSGSQRLSDVLLLNVRVREWQIGLIWAFMNGGQCEKMCVVVFDVE